MLLFIKFLMMKSNVYKINYFIKKLSILYIYIKKYYENIICKKIQK